MGGKVETDDLTVVSVESVYVEARVRMGEKRGMGGVSGL